jgi:WD40 repeat protein
MNPQVIVVGFDNGEVFVLEPESLEIRRRFKSDLEDEPGRIQATAAVSRNGEVLVIKSSCNSFKSFDMVSGSELYTFKAPQDKAGLIGPITISDDGLYAATAHMPLTPDSKTCVVTWSMTTSTARTVFENYTASPVHLAFSPSGHFLVCSDESGECSEFCLTGADFMTRNIHTEYTARSSMCSIAWEPTSNYYICGHMDGSVITVESGGFYFKEGGIELPEGTDFNHTSAVPTRAMFTRTRDSDSIAALSVSPDGSLVAAGSNRISINYTASDTVKTASSIGLYESYTNKKRWETWTDPIKDGDITSISFGLCGDVIATVSGCGCVRLLSTDDGSILAKVDLSSRLSYVSFCKDVEHEKKCLLAAAMGLHERLGSASTLQILPVDIMDKILRTTANI